MGILDSFISPEDPGTALRQKLSPAGADDGRWTRGCSQVRMQARSEPCGVGTEELRINGVSLGSRVMTPALKPPAEILTYLASLWQQMSDEGSAAVAKILIPGTLPW